MESTAGNAVGEERFRRLVMPASGSCWFHCEHSHLDRMHGLTDAWEAVERHPNGFAKDTERAKAEEACAARLRSALVIKYKDSHMSDRAALMADSGFFVEDIDIPYIATVRNWPLRVSISPALRSHYLAHEWARTFPGKGTLLHRLATTSTDGAGKMHSHYEVLIPDDNGDVRLPRLPLADQGATTTDAEVHAMDAAPSGGGT